MLPGFRFLFAAIVFSMSILVFGIGAAALLRAAHEQFASNPSWHAAAEATFAQQAEATRPVLAMLRVEPPHAEQKAPDRVPAVNVPAIPEPAEQAAIAPPPPEPEKVAALKPQEPSLPEAAKPGMPVSENQIPSEAAPAQTGMAAADATKLATPSADGETKIASTGQVATEPVLPPASEAAPAATEANPAAASQASAPASPEADIASTKIATLDSPSVTVGANPPAKAVSPMPDRSIAEKRQQARRAAHRRRMAARARQAQMAAQQTADPFAQFAQPPVAQPPVARPPAPARNH
jgi:hypothetical protein